MFPFLSLPTLRFHVLRFTFHASRFTIGSPHLLLPRSEKQRQPPSAYFERATAYEPTAGLTYTADPSVLVWKCATIYGVRWYESETLKKALDFLRRARDRYPFHKLLSHKYPLTEINRAFEESDQGHVTRAALVMK